MLRARVRGPTNLAQNLLGRGVVGQVESFNNEPDHEGNQDRHGYEQYAGTRRDHNIQVILSGGQIVQAASDPPDLLVGQADDAPRRLPGNHRIAPRGAPNGSIAPPIELGAMKQVNITDRWYEISASRQATLAQISAIGPSLVRHHRFDLFRKKSRRTIP